MSEALTLEWASYQSPDGMEDFAEREADGKRIILYIGDKAMVDIVGKGHVDELEEVPDRLLLRLEADRNQALNLYHHPAVYATTEDALRVFENQKEISEAA